MVLLVLNARQDGSDPMSAIEDLPPSFFLDGYTGLSSLSLALFQLSGQQDGIEALGLGRGPQIIRECSHLGRVLG